MKRSFLIFLALLLFSTSLSAQMVKTGDLNVVAVEQCKALFKIPFWLSPSDAPAPLLREEEAPWMVHYKGKSGESVRVRCYRSGRNISPLEMQGMSTAYYITNVDPEFKGNPLFVSNTYDNLSIDITGFNHVLSGMYPLRPELAEKTGFNAEMYYMVKAGDVYTTISVLYPKHPMYGKDVDAFVDYVKENQQQPSDPGLVIAKTLRRLKAPAEEELRYYEAVYLWQEEEKANEAMKLLRKNKEEYKSRFTLAFLLLQEKEDKKAQEEALKILLKLAGEDPEKATTFDLLMEVYLQQEEFDKAYSIVEHCKVHCKDVSYSFMQKEGYLYLKREEMENYFDLMDRYQEKMKKDPYRKENGGENGYKLLEKWYSGEGKEEE